MSARDDLLALSGERDQWQRYALDLARWMYQAGYNDGRADERRRSDRAWAARPPQPVKAGLEFAEIDRRRHHVCCRQCRLSGCRPGCRRCEERTAESYVQTHPDDYAGNGTGEEAA